MSVCIFFFFFNHEWALSCCVQDNLTQSSLCSYSYLSNTHLATAPKRMLHLYIYIFFNKLKYPSKSSFLENDCTVLFTVLNLPSWSRYLHWSILSLNKLSVLNSVEVVVLLDSWLHIISLCTKVHSVMLCLFLNQSDFKCSLSYRCLAYPHNHSCISLKYCANLKAHSVSDSALHQAGKRGNKMGRFSSFSESWS